MIQIVIEDPASSDSHVLLEELSEILARITGDSGKASFDPDDVRSPRARFVIARDGNGEALGCGAFRPLQGAIAEVKRMYARPGTIGVGSAVLAFLEAEARALGYKALWLETRLVNVRAVRFYEHKGYRRIPNFGKYAGNPKAVCFERPLADTNGAK
ncbi:MAG TPA: GNAT family N-acetyltransferase [Bradyrhizobium sp.]|nr:GNAT family N-acetyltransferase [Bradyrhizobium sp.]